MQSGDSEATQGVFVIDGEECEFPDLGAGFSMDEAMVFFDYAGFAIEDLMVDDEMDEEEAAERERQARSPKVFAALMHIAYARKHPQAKESNVRKIVKATDFATALSRMAEDDASPPDLISEESSQLDENGKPLSSGDASAESSDEPAGDPSPTGTSESDTSSTSPPISLAR